MRPRLERLRERTNGYTVTPHQYAYVAYVALGALTLIVLSGAAVRLTGSGLGCPDWPKCYGNAYPPLTSACGDRVLEPHDHRAGVDRRRGRLAAGAAPSPVPPRPDVAGRAAAARRRSAQAVLGGFTVRGALDYGWVMGHFALSMLILLAAALLAWRAGEAVELDAGASCTRGALADGARAAVPLAPIAG